MEVFFGVQRKLGITSCRRLPSREVRSGNSLVVAEVEAAVDFEIGVVLAVDRGSGRPVRVPTIHPVCHRLVPPLRVIVVLRLPLPLEILVFRLFYRIYSVGLSLWHDCSLMFIVTVPMAPIWFGLSDSCTRAGMAVVVFIWDIRFRVMALVNGIILLWSRVNCTLTGSMTAHSIDPFPIGRLRGFDPRRFWGTCFIPCSPRFVSISLGGISR